MSVERKNGWPTNFGTNISSFSNGPHGTDFIKLANQHQHVRGPVTLGYQTSAQYVEAH